MEGLGGDGTDGGALQPPWVDTQLPFDPCACEHSPVLMEERSAQVLLLRISLWMPLWTDCAVCGQPRAYDSSCGLTLPGATMESQERPQGSVKRLLKIRVFPT